MFTRLSLIVLVCTLVAGFCETAYAQTGACCIGGGCMIDTEANCIGGGGVYAGDNTDCAGSGAGGGADCNANGVIDTCDIANCSFGDPTCDDCNNNGIPDECDISSGSSMDVDMNGVPDECIFWVGALGGGDGINWGEAGNWSPPTVPNNGLDTFSVVFDPDRTMASINVHLNIDATINTMRLLDKASGSVTLTFTTNNLAIASPNGIRDDGQITINDTHSLQADVSFVITGKGRITLNGASASILSLPGNRITSNITIDGQGIINADFTNNSSNTVDANVAGGTLDIRGNVTNNGTMSGTTGGTLDINTNITEDPGGNSSFTTEGGTVLVGDDADDPRTVDGCGPIDVQIGSPGIFTVSKSSLLGFQKWTIGNTPQGDGPRATMTVRNTSTGVVAGPIEVNGNGDLFVNRSAVVATDTCIIDTGRLDMSGLAPDFGIMTLTGPYCFTGTDETLINWGPGSRLQMQGGQFLCNPNKWNVTIEAGGTDFGPGNFPDNFNLSELVIDPDAHVRLVDLFNNGNRGGPAGFSEAVYVDSLTIGANALLFLNGLTLYVNGVPTPPGSFGGAVVELEGCCFPDGTCTTTFTSCCTANGGTPQGLGTACTADEACVFPDGTCFDRDPLCCLAEGGVPQGPGSICPQACCLADGTCTFVVPSLCFAAGGSVQPQGEICTAPEACCFANIGCVMMDPVCCAAQGGSPLGAGTVCVSSEACCVPAKSCINIDPACCAHQGGIPLGPGGSCQGDNNHNGADDACESVAPVPALSGTGRFALILLILVMGLLAVRRGRSTA